jgi:serine/threonine-protein kinase
MNAADVARLLEENALLRQEVRVAREAAQITAGAVVQQFAVTELALARLQSVSAEQRAVLDAASQVAVIAADRHGVIRPFMVMDLLHGEGLGDLLGRLGPVAPELALRIAAQAAEGLRKAHQAGVVHRDIKPANLFLARAEAGRRVVKLLDFGVAKVKLDWAVSDEAGGLTRTGAVLGSPLYMAPEQARGSRKVDDRADLWSLGVVLYRALAGRVPNQEIDALGELIIAICTQPPESIRDVAPGVPKEIAAVVHRALTLDPAQRFQSAAEMLEAIARLVPSTSILDADLVRSRPPSAPSAPRPPPRRAWPRASAARAAAC